MSRAGGHCRGEPGFVKQGDVADDAPFLLELVLAVRDPVPLEQVAQVPALPAADLEGLRAARMERAAKWRTRGVRNLSPWQVARDALRRVRLRDRLEQRLGVGMLGIGVDLFGRAVFDDPA